MPSRADSAPGVAIMNSPAVAHPKHHGFLITTGLKANRSFSLI
jgi:hypothetical protein